MARGDRSPRAADDVTDGPSLFGFTADDEASLDRIRFAIREDLPGLLDVFYEDQPPAHKDMRHTLEPLRQAQKGCLSTLGLDTHTEEYIEVRTRLAALHEAAGLDRTWYAAAQGRLFEPIARLVSRHHRTPQPLLCVLCALQRILAFDLHIVTDAYVMAALRRVEGIVDAVTESKRRELEVSRKDSLTKIDTRASLLAMLEQELTRSRRGRRTFSLLFVDLDNFKPVNDAYGHAAGDRMLCALVDAIKRSLRPADIIGRYGGDEFLVGLVEADLATAEQIASRVCQSVRSAPTRCGPMTVSIGCATALPGDSVAELIHRADRAMYAAKAAGRNRVSAFAVPEPQLAGCPARALAERLSAE